MFKYVKYMHVHLVSYLIKQNNKKLHQLIFLLITLSHFYVFILYSCFHFKRIISVFQGYIFSVESTFVNLSEYCEYGFENILDT